MKTRSNYLQFVCFVLILVFCISVLPGCVPKKRNIDSADVNATFEEDIDDLQLVADYLCDFDYDYVIIENSKDIMIVDGGERKPIANVDVKEIVESLFSKGYQRLAKNYNTIKFHRWDKSFDMEFQAGFAFVYDGSEDLDISFVVHQEPLSKDNWYYYEANYNEYRLTH